MTLANEKKGGKLHVLLGKKKVKKNPPFPPKFFINFGNIGLKII